MFTIQTPKTTNDFKAYYALRYRVLREPWGHPRGTEKDDYEPISEHFMAMNEKGDVVGVAKLYEKTACVGHVSHVAVAPEYQHRGVGRLLLETVEQRARSRGFHTLGIMARVTAAAYFEKYGFRIVSIPAPHLAMVYLVWMEKAFV
ncbi:MAG TPA: GNAT family N-acetyltransferase [Anaerolineales bacterium]|nr:GNAT family N-acetyltransferase [Anaerolineales bacterium]